MASLVNSTKQLNTNPPETFPKIEGGTLPNSFYEASTILKTKSEKDPTRKLQINIPYEH